MATRTPDVSGRRGFVNVPPVDHLPEGRIVDLPGRGSTFVTEAGNPDGPPLIMLHALACTGLLTWYPALRALEERYRIVIFDQRWHGRGVRSPEFRLEDCADDVVAVADALGVDRFTAVGYSLGALVAQLVWQRHRERTAGLVLGAATTGFRRHARERLALDAITRGVRAFPKQPPLPRARPDDVGGVANMWALRQFRQTGSATIGAGIAEIGRFDSTAWVTEIDVPTSVIVTADDRVVAPGRQRWLAGHIPDSSSYEVQAGHAGCVMQADRFTPAVRAACASVTARVTARARR